MILIQLYVSSLPQSSSAELIVLNLLQDLMQAQADLDAQMAVKDVFDPGWLLNPAKVFPLDASESHRAA